ncbi:hypothetical protein REJ26_001179 [Providencia stuartii]|uniref:hypothetical protein n=1 Tax=Providencia TaxID=586 RepID=UPI00293FEB05|nr:hypothetical protein [Providencia sp. 2023EL-00965]ELR5299438.1 hypothetical protein [Providencia stuartii]MDW7588512.1 hypothetical protein [Providencia sp. 2023EL-00965]
MVNKEIKPVLDDKVIQLISDDIDAISEEQVMRKAWDSVDTFRYSIDHMKEIYNQWIELGNKILDEDNNNSSIDNYLYTLNDIFNDATQSYDNIYDSMNSVMFSYREVLDSMLPIFGDISGNIYTLEKQLLAENQKSYGPVENHNYTGPLRHELIQKTHELLSAFRKVSDTVNKVAPEISSLYKSHIEPKLINDSSSLINDLVSGNLVSISMMFAQRIENTLEDIQYWSDPISEEAPQPFDIESTSRAESQVIDAASCFGTKEVGFETNMNNMTMYDKDINLLSIIAVPVI